MILCRLITSWCRNFQLRDCFALTMLVLFSTLVPIANAEVQQVQAPPARRLWYVSKNGSGADGKSWKSAWSELDRIRWDVIQAGDTINIDGGTSSLTYTTTLTVGKSGTDRSPIVIAQSAEAGHNGTIFIHGPATGISIQNRSSVCVIGARWRGIVVENSQICGVIVSAPMENKGVVLLQNIEVRKCGQEKVKPGSGVLCLGTNLTLNQVISHDNYPSNIRTSYDGGVNFGNGPELSLQRCWLYNDATKSDGLLVETPDGPNYGPRVHARDCIYGPGLVHATRLNHLAHLFVEGGLFINSNQSNCTFDSFPCRLAMVNTTSFLTRLNAQGQAHSFVNALDPKSPITISNTVVFGGSVLLAPKGSKYGDYNMQFRTTGNTSALSYEMFDPMFRTNVGAYPDNVSNAQLINTDFSFSPGSPAVGKGARITSVKQLLAN